MASKREALLAGLATILGLDEPERILAGEAVVIDGVTFSFLHMARIHPDRLYLFADFGSLPAGRETEAMEKLLIHNHTAFSDAGPGFAINPASCRVMYALHIKMGRNSPRDIAAKMAFLAEKANQWRTDFFLGGPKRSSRRLR